jgi:DNA processing protein
MRCWSDQRCAWIALASIPGLGNIGSKNLIERFGCPEAVFDATLGELLKVDAVRESTARRILKGEFLLDADKELQRLEKYGGRLITLLDPFYPSSLREIHDPPLVLYAKGREFPSSHPFIAVVGSRNATHYGLKSAETMGMGLARRGMGVVSGLARGIDSAAHRGCLRGGGFTVAVMGTGLNVIYPGANRNLFEEIMNSGAVLSEFPLDTPPEPRNFPIRNRIISGMSSGVVVVEATRKSGSLITAFCALDQGREVFAVPGSIDSFKSMGSHHLIKQGAKLVENADDVLDGLLFDDNLDKGVDPGGYLHHGELEASERKILEVVGAYPIHIDEILRSACLDAAEGSSLLMKMELKGILKQLPGKMFVR